VYVSAAAGHQVDSNVNGKVDVSSQRNPFPCSAIKPGLLIGPPIRSLCRIPPQRHHLNATCFTHHCATPPLQAPLQSYEPDRQNYRSVVAVFVAVLLLLYGPISAMGFLLEPVLNPFCRSSIHVDSGSTTQTNSGDDVAMTNNADKNCARQTVPQSNRAKNIRREIQQSSEAVRSSWIIGFFLGSAVRLLFRIGK